MGPVTTKVEDDITWNEHPPGKMHFPWNKVVNKNYQVKQTELSAKALATLPRPTYTKLTVSVL